MTGINHPVTSRGWAKKRCTCASGWLRRAVRALAIALPLPSGVLATSSTIRAAATPTRANGAQLATPSSHTPSAGPTTQPTPP